MAETAHRPTPPLTRRTWFLYLVPAFVLVGLIGCAALALGPHGFHPSELSELWRPTSGAAHRILLYLRVPRVLAALLVGWALATAGTVYQGMLQNPLAEPYLLGISGGAALGATLATLTEWIWPSFLFIPWSAAGAFLGALFFTLVIYRLAQVRGQLPVFSLILAGVVLNAIASAVILFITVTRSYFEVQRVALWLIGQIQPPSYPMLLFAGLWVGSWTAAIWHDAPYFNMMTLGDDVLASWGISVHRLRTRWLVFGAALAAIAVALSGMIGFVGLIVPHAVRLLVGHDHRLLVPLSGCTGAVLLVIADSLARSLWSPTEIPVGVLTAALAGPYFLWLLRRSLKQTVPI